MANGNMVNNLVVGKMNTNQYICAECDQVFTSDWEDSDAILEFEKLYPGKDIKESIVICDDCFKGGNNE